MFWGEQKSSLRYLCISIRRTMSKLYEQLFTILSIIIKLIMLFKSLSVIVLQYFTYFSKCFQNVSSYLANSRIIYILLLFESESSRYPLKANPWSTRNSKISIDGNTLSLFCSTSVLWEPSCSWIFIAWCGYG